LPAIFAFVAVLLQSANAVAITNIESERVQPANTGWSGQIDLSADGDSGNTNKKSVELAAKVVYVQNQYTTLLILESEYGESSKIKDTNNNFVHLRTLQNLSTRLATEQYLQYQDDEFKLLNSRQLAGGGVRYLMTPDTKNISLHLGAGAYYTEERWNLEPEELVEDYARGSFYSSYKHQLTDTIFIIDTLYLQPRLSQPSDLYIYNQFSIKIDIYKALSLKFSLESSHDTDPVSDLKKTDQSYSTALVYNF
jgi:putative salt-induced outer membrane protein YdiY